MMILDKSSSYTFSQIFELKHDTEEILAELGYGYQIVPLTLPRAANNSALLTQLRQQMRDRLPYVPLTSETARREFYIAPLLFAALDQAKFKMSIEYRVVSRRLRGDVDYLLRGAGQLVIVEAKQADLEHGFTQLAAELIALVEYWPEPPTQVYGAVTTGSVWRFGVLDCEAKTVYKDIEEYLAPRDLETLYQILLGLLGEDYQTSVQ